MAKTVSDKSTERCFYCTSRATFKTNSLSMRRHSCTEHKPLLLQFEQQTKDDGYMSEADYQTWGRL